MTRSAASVAVLILAATTDAWAGNGSIVCRVLDERGRSIDGTCTAVQGSIRLQCATSAGRCTIASVPPGSWEVRVAPVGGTPPGPSTARVEADAPTTVILNVTVGSGGSADAGTDARTDAGSDAGSRDDAARTVADAGDAPRFGDASWTRTTAPDAGVRPFRTVVQPAREVRPPDRSTGTVLSVQGRTSDSRGRPIDGTVTVSRDGTAIGYAPTVAGQYRLYDLPQGSVTLVFAPVSGSSVTKTATCGSSAVTVNFALPAD